ncbi:MAG: class I SAM-dependent methyltransferase [Pyrinomonadaceae bacterium]
MLDVSEEALKFCRERGLTKVKLGAAERLPYADKSFDLVTALDVVEHLDDDVAGLKEMRRVLRPGGRSLLFVPAFMFLWGVQDDVSHHRRRYTIAQLKKSVATAGLEVGARHLCQSHVFRADPGRTPFDASDGPASRI